MTGEMKVREMQESDRLVFADRKDPAHLVRGRGNAGREDLPPCLNVILLEDPADGDVGLYQVVLKSRR